MWRSEHNIRKLRVVKYRSLYSLACELFNYCTPTVELSKLEVQGLELYKKHIVDDIHSIVSLESIASEEELNALKQKSIEEVKKEIKNPETIVSRVIYRILYDIAVEYIQTLRSQMDTFVLDDDSNRWVEELNKNAENRLREEIEKKFTPNLDLNFIVSEMLNDISENIIRSDANIERYFNNRIIFDRHDTSLSKRTKLPIQLSEAPRSTIKAVPTPVEPDESPPPIGEYNLEKDEIDDVLNKWIYYLLLRNESLNQFMFVLLITLTPLALLRFIKLVPNYIIRKVKKKPRRRRRRRRTADDECPICFRTKDDGDVTWFFLANCEIPHKVCDECAPNLENVCPICRTIDENGWVQVG